MGVRGHRLNGYRLPSGNSGSGVGLRTIRRARFPIAILALLSAACSSGGTEDRADTGASPVVVRLTGGQVTRDDVLREANRLPPALRDQFDRGPAGRAELARSIADKRLLVQEAIRRGFADDPEIKRQVTELEERLLVNALFAAEEKAAARAGDDEVRAYYEVNRDKLTRPERVRLGRVLVRLRDGSERGARNRAESLRRRLVGGEAFEVVGKEGDGPERLRGGDLGLIETGSLEPAVADAAKALREAGEVSPILRVPDGLAILVLLERKPSELPPVDEVRAEIEARLGPVKKRRLFDRLLERLRDEAHVVVDVDALK